MKRIASFVFSHLQNPGRWIFILFVMSLFILSGRAIPVLFGRVIDLGIVPQDSQMLTKLCYAFFAASLLRSLSGFCVYFLVGLEGNKITYSVRKFIFSHVLSLKIPFFDKTPSGKVLTKVANDTRSFQQLIGEGFIGLFINSFELISIFIALFVESWILSCVVVFVFPFSAWVSFKITKEIRKQYFLLKENLSELNSFLADSLNGYSIIKGYSLYPIKEEAFYKESKDYYQKQIKISYLFAKLWPQIEYVQLMTILAGLILGIYLIEQNLLLTGSLVAYILLVQSIFHPLRFILERINQIQNGLTSTERLIQLCEEKPEEDSTTLKMIEGVNAAKGLEFKDLHFAYEPSKPLFKGLNLKVNLGETLALTGRTGSGKTSLISLLQRFYLLDEGHIFLHGKDINSLSLKELRSMISVVRQEDFIFSGNLLDNICLNEIEKPNRQKAEEALEFAQIHKPLDFKVESSGQNLSMGERQLLSFARIYYHDPKIIVFDEATSFIDEETEALIQKKAKILFKDKTVLIIAHKKASIDFCDRIVDLESL